MTSDDAHTALRVAWSQTRRWLLRLRKMMDFGDETHHVEFAEKANRAASLVLYLDAAVASADDNLYAPAFAIVRSGLEHAVFDWLMYRGSTYVQRFRSVPEETWLQWQRDRANGDPSMARVVDWSRTKNGDVIIRRAGLFNEGEEPDTRGPISIYYFLLQEYDGTIGKPADQESDGFLSRDELRALATENEARWFVYLRWSALMDNLVENRLIDDVDRGRLDVHYRFLSTFAHPVSVGPNRVYGSPLDGRAPRYAHDASELVLLYVIALAVLELRNYRVSVRSTFGKDVAEAGAMDEDLRVVDDAIGHFWFLGNQPHQWDIHQAVNRIALQQVRSGLPIDVPPPSPEDVAFPRDPLSRLTKQHSHSEGLVRGSEYTSPWPRATGSPL